MVTSTKTSLPSEAELEKFIDVEACHEYARWLVKELGKKYGLIVEDGYYKGGSHSWTRAPDGTIVDTTAGQFPDGQLFVPPAHPSQNFYISYTRDWPGVNAYAAKENEMTIAELIESHGLDVTPQEVEDHFALLQARSASTL